jgi:hypothetical protein
MIGWLRRWRNDRWRLRLYACRECFTHGIWRMRDGHSHG